MTDAPFGIGFVGCGYVADFYAANLGNHPNLKLVGVYDRIQQRAQAVSARYGVPSYNSLNEMLARPELAIVINLTNPESHFEVTRQALESGRHVYSEKPLAGSLKDASELLALAESRHLGLACAPCVVLGEAFQTLWRHVLDGSIGKPLVAVCRLHDGAIHRMRYDLWTSASGAPWPATDEFKTGCVREHAGYVLEPLVALFGSVRAVCAETALMYPYKCAAKPAEDWASAILSFDNGVRARVSLSIVEPPERSFTVTGSDGVIAIEDIWRSESPISLRRAHGASPKDPRAYLHDSESISLIRGYHRPCRYFDSHDMDQVSGIASFGRSILVGQFHLGRRALHILEATLLIAAGRGHRETLTTVSPRYTPEG